MDDTLLTSLCKICHIDPPKYTCPRCLAETCSLTCSKRHKIWSSCNGVRDATAYKPISEVATPSGIDHDYNFLHAIEHGISRSEKVLIEDLGLVTNEELKRARLGDDGHAPRKRQKVHNELPGEACIRKVLDENKITIRMAPRGMRRNRENTTGWSRKRKTIDWQVEWLRDAPAGRTLYKVSGNRPIGEQYEALCEEERRMNMTDDERREAKKKKAYEVKMRAAKKRGDGHDLFAAAVALLQDPDTGTWCKLSSVVEPTQVLVNECVPVRVPPTYHLYLLRPLTPASFPKVIVPIDVRRSLTDLLANRELLEYPTIYVLEQDPHHLPSTFMLEVDYLAATGARRTGDTGLVSGKGPGNDDETSSYSDATETTSSSSSDSSSSDEERVE